MVTDVAAAQHPPYIRLHQLGFAESAALYLVDAALYSLKVRPERLRQSAFSRVYICPVPEAAWRLGSADCAAPGPAQTVACPGRCAWATLGRPGTARRQSQSLHPLPGNLRATLLLDGMEMRLTRWKQNEQLQSSLPCLSKSQNR